MKQIIVLFLIVLAFTSKASSSECIESGYPHIDYTGIESSGICDGNKQITGYWITSTGISPLDDSEIVNAMNFSNWYDGSAHSMNIKCEENRTVLSVKLSEPINLDYGENNIEVIYRVDKKVAEKTDLFVVDGHQYIFFDNHQAIPLLKELYSAKKVFFSC